MANSSVCCSVGREASVVHVINAWLKEFLRVHDVLRTISGAVRNGVAIPGRRSRSSRAVGVRSGFGFISVSYSYPNLHFIVLLAFLCCFLDSII